MYRIKDEYGNIIDELVNPTWLKQQKRVDRPICANGYEEADGVLLSDGETMRGIAGRGMDNYTPLVTVEEVSGEPYIFQNLTSLLASALSQEQLGTDTQNIVIDAMSGMADLYETAMSNQQMQLDTMSGLADLFDMMVASEGGTNE